MSNDELQKFFAQAKSRFDEKINNHFQSMGFKVTAIEAGKATLEMAYQPHLAGDPFTGAVASGPIAALLDTCCAYAAASVKKPIGFSPTLDLRVDHVRVAKAGETLIAQAQAYHESEHVLFTRGVVTGENGRPVAYGLANFTPIDHTIIAGGN